MVTSKGVDRAKKALLWLMIIGLIPTLFLICGCGNSEDSDKRTGNDTEPVVESGDIFGEGDGRDGEDAPDHEGDSVPQEDDGDIEPPREGQDGTGTIPEVYREVPTGEQLGAPVYQGATYLPYSGGSATGAGPEGEMSVTYAEFTSSDAFDEVVEFYESSLGQPQHKDASMQEAMWMKKNRDGSFTIVSVRNGDSGLVIAIGRTTGDIE